jgi:hypothetical protein
MQSLLIDFTVLTQFYEIDVPTYLFIVWFRFPYQMVPHYSLPFQGQRTNIFLHEFYLWPNKTSSHVCSDLTDMAQFSLVSEPKI